MTNLVLQTYLDCQYGLDINVPYLNDVYIDVIQPEQKQTKLLIPSQKQTKPNETELKTITFNTNAQSFKPKNKQKKLPSSPYIKTSIRNNTQLVSTNSVNTLTYTFTIQLPEKQTNDSPKFYYYFQDSDFVNVVKSSSFEDFRKLSLTQLNSIKQDDSQPIETKLRDICVSFIGSYTKPILLSTVDEVNKYYNLYINLIETMDVIHNIFQESIDKTKDSLVKLLTEYVVKPINNNVTLPEIVNTFDEFNKRYVQFVYVLTNDIISYNEKYNTMLIPKDYLNYKNYISYSINYTFMVNPEWSYWVELKNVDYDFNSKTLDIGYNINNIIKSNKNKLDKRGFNYKNQGDNGKYLIAFNLNNYKSNYISTNSICFILSQNEFKHLEPNVTPWIFA